MDSRTKVVVRLEPEVLSALQRLVDIGEYPSLAEAVRRAVIDFIGREDVKVTESHVPEKVEIDFGEFISDGSVEAFDQAIRDAVESRLRAREDIF